MSYGVTHSDFSSNNNDINPEQHIVSTGLEDDELSRTFGDKNNFLSLFLSPGPSPLYTIYL